MTADPFTAYMDQIQELIDRIGWACQGVFPGLHDEDPRCWVYTVGFGPSLGHPELAMFGLPFEITCEILNGVGERLRVGGPAWIDGETRTDVVGPQDGVDMPVCAVTVAPDYHADHFGVAIRYYREHALGEPTFLQLMWPDSKGLLPWQDGFDEQMRDAQPILGNHP